MDGFWDMHCHILPGVDDGPPDVETAVDLVCGLESIGITRLYPTPHSRPGLWDPPEEETDAAWRALCDALADVGSQVTVQRPAREYMLRDTIARGTTEGLCLYPGERAFLVEFPVEGVPPAVADGLFKYRLDGVLPVVAHVERYPSIAQNDQRLDALGRVAALQVNLSALSGWLNGRRARDLLLRQKVHLVASDGHGPGDVEAGRQGIRWIRRKLGEETLHRLLVDNPRQVLQGELPQLPEPVKRRFFKRG